MVKLTDEMFAALEEGQRSGKKLRIHVDEREGRVEIGDGTASSKTNNTFLFHKQTLPVSSNFSFFFFQKFNFKDQTDTLIQSGGGVRNVGTYKTKYQVSNPRLTTYIYFEFSGSSDRQIFRRNEKTS